MQTLCGLFGNPEDVAESHTLLKQPYMLLRTWLRVAEALLRRLLILEASAFPKPNTPTRRWAHRTRARKFRTFHPDKPQDWRVSFRCFTSVRTTVSVRRARPNKRFFDAWPLAERYEAILRVFNNPNPFARRLAKRLHALPHRLKEVMRAPDDAHHKIGDDEWNQLTTRCEDTRCFADSS